MSSTDFFSPPGQIIPIVVPIFLRWMTVCIRDAKSLGAVTAGLVRQSLPVLDRLNMVHNPGDRPGPVYQGRMLVPVSTHSLKSRMSGFVSRSRISRTMDGSAKDP